MFIRVKVFPNSSKEVIKKTKENAFEMRVREKAEHNLANSRVVVILSELFPWHKGIKLITGATRPSKTFEIIEPTRELFEE